MKPTPRKLHERKSIFRALFAPLLLIMALQAVIFYFAAVYGGIEESLSQNAADILSERLYNRKNEIETQFNNRWSDLDACSLSLGELYKRYETESGARPLTANNTLQIQFLRESADLLIGTLRQNEVNGIFLILNNQSEKDTFAAGVPAQKYGLCIRDMDQDSSYSGREDLLLERSPSSIIDALGCPLDSWWEAKYSFALKADGDYYYRPLDAAWANPGAAGADLAYCSDAHQISGSDPAMISYSIPLISDDGYPYGVLGVEISVKHLASLLPNKELNKQDKCCYVLALQNAYTLDCAPIVGTGALYSRCFDSASAISPRDVNATGGFSVTGRGGVKLYGASAQLNVYNNNNPFEDQQLTLLAFVETDTLFAYIGRVKATLMIVSLLSLLLGVAGIVLVSRRFASPITALAERVRGMDTQKTFELDRLGITEIDQLVDSIEDLHRNVSRNSARTEFFSRMSHDMRTPMNAIISFSSEELLDGVTEAVKDDYLQKIHASGEYLLALINDVLDMTKIENSKTELRFAACEACRLFDTTIPIIDKLAQKRAVSFAVDVRMRPGVYIETDAQHLNQIVMNLLSNAVKFTPEGGSVRLFAELTDDDDPSRMRCRIEVSDTGIGMSEPFLKQLYTPFAQETDRQDGTGLGLSIARKLVELMGGTIDCESRVNAGTTFTVTFSFAKGAPADSDTEVKALADETLLSRSLAGKRILVCEDNSTNALIVRRLLERWGISIALAENGKIGVDAFAASAANAFDAILMDVRMPVMDGLTAVRHIRALDRPDAKRIPIIAMTANAFAEDEQDSRKAGMNAHLAKPVDPAALLRTLNRFLCEAQAEDRG